MWNTAEQCVITTPLTSLMLFCGPEQVNAFSQNGGGVLIS